MTDQPPGPNIGPPIGVICDGCDEWFIKGDSLFRCEICCDICLVCVLSKKSLDIPSECSVRPGFLYLRDSQVTFLLDPSLEEFPSLLRRTVQDRSFKIPTSAEKFLSGVKIGAKFGCNVEDLVGRLSAASIRKDEDKDEDEEAQSVQMRRIENDYSLYVPLDRSRREIRLARMQKRNDRALHFVTARFEYPWKQVEWGALSYHWGPLDETRRIRLGHAPELDAEKEAADGAVLFNCTASLEIALAALRDCGVPTEWLWADALCISQSDPEERAYQVGIMAEIFAAAASVHVWLGLEPKTVRGMDMIKSVSDAAGKHRRPCQHCQPCLRQDEKLAKRMLSSNDIDLDGAIVN